MFIMKLQYSKYYMTRLTDSQENYPSTLYSSEKYTTFS